MVKILRRRMYGRFQGMNYYAKKELRRAYNVGKDEIIVDSRLKGKAYTDTVRHELIERYLMKYKHLKYAQADKCASALEEYDVDKDAIIREHLRKH